MNEKIDALLNLNLTYLYWTREKVNAVGGAFDAYVIRNKHTGEPITAISELTEGAEMYADLFSQAPEMLADLRRILMAAKEAQNEKENHSPRNQLESISRVFRDPSIVQTETPEDGRKEWTQDK